MSFTTSVLAGYDTTLPQSVIDRQSDANLRLAALSAFAALAPGMDTVEGSFAFDLIEPFCLVLAQAYSDLIDIERRTSLATATGLDLDRMGELYAVSRGPASFAGGTVTFTGLAGSPIARGTSVSTVGVGAQIFQTTTPAVIPGASGQGTVDVPVTAVNVGVGGNVPAGSVTIFAGAAPAGLQQVNNAAAMTGGTDIQQDGPQNQYYTGYRADIYNLENTRGEGGAAKHLRKWARSVSGVGGVHVQEVTPQAGWATVVLLGTNGQPATPDVVHNVEATILDPWYIYNDPELVTSQMAITGAATRSTQADGTPLGGTNNTVLLTGSAAAGIRQSRIDQMLPQPGVWRLKPRFKVNSTALTTNLVTFGVWDINTGAWCTTRPNNNGTPAYRICTASQLQTTFVYPDVDAIYVDFAWNGIDFIEMHIDLGVPNPVTGGGVGVPADTTTQLFVDQVNYFAAMSRDDRDMGLSPAGMRVNVVPALPVTVNVTAVITYALSAGQTVATVNAAINSAVTSYLANLAFTANASVRRAAIEDTIYNTFGVGDVSNVQLNGATNNITIAPTQVAVAGTLVWTSS